MGEKLKVLNIVDGGIEDCEMSLAELVSKTIGGEITEPYAIYYAALEDEEALFRHRELIGTHKDNPGGYGQHKVALSLPESDGVWIVERRDNQLMVVANPGQLPINQHRDLVHYIAVGLNNYYCFDAETVRLVLDDFIAKSTLLLTDKPLLPNTTLSL